MKNANFKYTILSYNSDGIINEKVLENLMNKHSKKINKKYKFPYRRYKKDSKERKDVLYEMIFFIKNK